MKLRHKIIIGYLVIAALSVIIGQTGISKVTSIQDDYLQVSHETVPVLKVLHELKLAGMTIMASTSEYLFILSEVAHANDERNETGNQKNRQRENQAARHEMTELTAGGFNSLKVALFQYKSLVLQKFQHEKTYLENITRQADNLVLASEKIITAKRMGDSGNSILALKDDFEEAEENFLVAVDITITHENQELAERNGNVEKSINTTFVTLYSASGVVFIFSLVGGFALSRTLAEPVEKLRKAVIGVSKGDLNISVEVDTHDEIGELGIAFNQMAQTIHNSQHQLQMMKEYSDSIIDSMSEALIILSPEGLIERCNYALCEILAYERDQELLGRDIQTIFKDAELFEGNKFKWLETSNQKMTTESTLEGQFGEPIAVQVLGSWMCDQKNEQGQLILLFQDIRERKAAEETLATNKQFLETILDNMVEEISVLNPHDFRIVRTNKAFQTAYNATEEELLGKPCYQVTHGHDKPCQTPNDYCPVEDSLKSRTAVACEHIHLDDNGDKKFCEIQVAPILVKSGDVNHIIHISRDITERKMAEKSLQEFTSQLEKNHELLLNKTAELEQAHLELKEGQSRILQQDKMASIGQLAAGVAHEINNPMGFIISNLNTLDKYLKKLVEFGDIQTAQLSEKTLEIVNSERKRLKINYLLEDMPDLLSESLDGADRVKKIVQDLKGFSRIDQAEFGRIDINECLDSTINIVWNEIKYNATLERDYRLESHVSCFAQQMTQVFINLLVNASHALEDQGVIRVSTWQDGEEAMISISDTGKGMSAEVSKRIFEPFFTTKEIGKGTGLGLSIVYDIIKKHHGEITVVSEPGDGTCFTIKIPVQQEEPTSVNPEKSDEPV